MKHKYIIVSLLSVLSQMSATVAAQGFKSPDPGKWYQLVTRYNGTDARKGRCIQYFPEGSEHPDMLWSADALSAGDADVEYQLWRFVPSPDTPDRYALVCKAAEDGFVNPMPEGEGRSARWKYVVSADSSTENPYGFLFVTTESMSGVEPTGESYCAIASDETVDRYYNVMNCAGAREGYAINLWNEDYSEDANEWLFRFVEHSDATTDISDVFVSEPDAPTVYYDLMGRAVIDPAPGLYIVNGHKVLIR